MRRILIFIFILTFTVITCPGFAASAKAHVQVPGRSASASGVTQPDGAASAFQENAIICAAPDADALPGDQPCEDAPGNQNLNEEHAHSQDLVHCGDSAPWLHLPGIARLAGDKLHDYASPHFPIATPPAN